MDLRVLKYFITVAECQNFSKASELLHITQPTLSRQIALLEEEVGMSLLRRTKPNLTLTMAGEVCLERARQILSEYDKMCYAISNIKEGNIGSINIGYVNTSQFKILTKAIDSIYGRCLDVNISVKQMSLPEVHAAVLNKTIDIGFEMKLNEDKSEGINNKKLTHSKLYAVVSKRHKFAERKNISIMEIKDEKLLIFERKQAPKIFDSLIDLCTKAGFTPSFSNFCEDMESVLLLAGLGQGIALMDETAKILETEHIIFIPIIDCKMNYNWYLSWHKENDNPCAQFIVDSICKLSNSNYE